MLRRCLFGAVLLAAVPASGHAETGSIDPSRIDRLARVAGDAPLAGEIAFTDASGLVQDRAIGLADRRSKRPHRVGQRWIWASVTKQVAALLVFQEVERGTIALDAPITRYLPDFRSSTGGLVTVAHLLQHRSGLPNPVNSPAAADGVQAYYRDSGAAITDSARASGYCAGPAKPPSDDRFEYNNCDYNLLGAILQKVTGQDFGALVASRIARPLKPRSLRPARDGAPGGGAAAVGYSGAKQADRVNVAALGAAGALTGTARDMAALDRALMAGRLLKPETQKMMWSGDPKLGYQAYGAWVFPASLRGCAGPVELVERRGDIAGTQVRNVIAPRLGRALAVFTNDEALDFGEIWEGKGLSYELLSIAFCDAAPR